LGDLVGEIVAGFVVVSLIAFLILRTRWPHIPIWAFMAFTSTIVVASGLTPVDELSSVVNLEVILFLVGMFSIVGVAESSGLLDALSLAVIQRFKSVYMAIVGLSFTFGLLAAIAVNDTVAVMGPPIAYFAAKTLNIDPKPLYMLLAFSITIGSTMTPIGNPQNMLIAVESGLRAPFISFLYYLALPTILNLALVAFIIVKAYGVKNGRVEILVIPREYIRNFRDAVVSGVALAAVIVVLLINDVLSV